MANPVIGTYKELETIVNDYASEGITCMITEGTSMIPDLVPYMLVTLSSMVGVDMKENDIYTFEDKETNIHIIKKLKHVLYGETGIHYLLEGSNRKASKDFEIIVPHGENHSDYFQRVHKVPYLAVSSRVIEKLRQQQSSEQEGELPNEKTASS
jgi:hypothetical protein